MAIKEGWKTFFFSWSSLALGLERGGGNTFSAIEKRGMYFSLVGKDFRGNT